MNGRFRGENENRIVRIKCDDIHRKILVFSVDYEVPYQNVFEAYCEAITFGYTHHQISDEMLFEMLLGVWLPF